MSGDVGALCHISGLGYAESSYWNQHIHISWTISDIDMWQQISNVSSDIDVVQGVFNWYPPKKLKYGKPRLGESTA